MLCGQNITIPFSTLIFFILFFLFFFVLFCSFLFCFVFGLVLVVTRRRRPAPPVGSKRSRRMRRKKTLQPNRQQSQCNYCDGQHHLQQRCPAIGVECRKCGRRNHFARVCRSGNQKIPPRIQELDYESPSEDEIIVATIEGTTRKD